MEYIGKTGIVESAAIKAGYCVKDGTAEKGVVIGTADAQCVGIAKGNVATEESFAVGANIPINLEGIGLGIAGATITSQANLQSDSAGKLSPIAANTSTTEGTTNNRVAISLEDALPGESIEVMVKNDIFAQERV